MFKNPVEGTSFVFTCTRPPAHSPGNSGTNALLMTMFSIMGAGKMSNEKVFLSGSVLDKRMPFNIAWLYLSASPRTTRYLPSWIEVPGTLFSTSLVFRSGDLRIASADTTCATVLVFFWKAIMELIDSLLALDALAVTTILLRS